MNHWNANGEDILSGDSLPPHVIARTLRRQRDELTHLRSEFHSIRADIKQIKWAVVGGIVLIFLRTIFKV